MSKTATELAGTLDYIVKKRLVPGLLPDSVAQAAQMLRDQAAELELLRTAQETKHHVVRVELEKGRSQMRRTLRATYIIASPVIYFAEIDVAEFELVDQPADYVRYLGKKLTRSGTANWLEDLELRTSEPLLAAIDGLRQEFGRERA